MSHPTHFFCFSKRTSKIRWFNQKNDRWHLLKMPGTHSFTTRLTRLRSQSLADQGCMLIHRPICRAQHQSQKGQCGDLKIDESLRDKTDNRKPAQAKNTPKGQETLELLILPDWISYPSVSSRQWVSQQVENPRLVQDLFPLLWKRRYCEGMLSILKGKLVDEVEREGREWEVSIKNERYAGLELLTLGKLQLR